ncbi:MAG: hypothetical protein IPO09_21850 [Anaeromyxobacter sp.]|nr:hypothetical protein [Anaeromyxobacter sp.]MBL0274594.1 hypothetical protein [Anaeromyxobacter sp.]
MPAPSDLPAALAALCGRPPLTEPPPDAGTWREAAAALGAPRPLQDEARWWRALERGRAGDWEAVGTLAEAGLGEPYSPREALRLAALHCLSGSVAEAEHVLSQLVQLHGDPGLPGQVAAWCEREGLLAAAARLRAGAAGPA